MLGVSERTIRRYVVALDDLGIAVDGQRRGSTRVIFARAPSAGRALLPALEEI
jgi:predicted DNA-binding transcriptional regulator YafY